MCSKTIQPFAHGYINILVDIIVHTLYIIQNYQQAMLKVIPHLQFLDQRPLTAEAAKQGCLVSQSSLLR